MGGENRLTSKKVAAELLPKITKAREVLTSQLVSLRYLWVEVEKRPATQFDSGEFALYQIGERLRRMEDELCQI